VAGREEGGAKREVSTAIAGSRPCPSKIDWPWMCYSMNSTWERRRPSFWPVN
jgi:hypothetical protein